MKYRLIAILLALLVLYGLGMVQAQNGEAEYQLHMPSAEEYLVHIPEILGSDSMVNGSNSLWQLVDTITTEWEIYFSQQNVSLDKLVNVFSTLAKTHEYWYGRGVFGKQLMQTFINDNILLFDPKKITTARYEAFDIEATPRDFDGDGQPEWTVYVQNPIFTQRYVVAYKDQHYQLIDVPLPWFGCCFGYNATASGFTEEQLFADLTGDGLPEWVLAFGGIGSNMMSLGRLYVMQWQNGKIIDVSASESSENKMSYESPAGGGSSLFPYGVKAEYEDKNNDGIRDIVIYQTQQDNWGCNWEIQRSFAWQGNEFSLINNQRVYDDVQGCEFRRAEEAVWSFDFETAIQHYERGLKLPITNEYFSGNPDEITRYAIARLAIAYKLAGRDEQATATINSLTPKETDSPTLVNFIAAIKANLDDDMRLCQAAYDVFNFECPDNTDACMGSPLKAVVGRTLENSGYDARDPHNGFPAAERAGCDLSAPVKTKLDTIPLSIQETPKIQLKKMGYPVVSTLHFDLNNDGSDEWLVWLDMPVTPLFFSHQKGEVNYQFSYVSIPYQFTHDYLYSRTNQKLNPYFDPHVQYKTVWLPDHSEKLLITVQARSHKGLSHVCPLNQPNAGVFVLWKLEAHQLLFQQDILLCNDTQYANTFGKEGDTLPLEINAWAYERGHYDQVNPATYQWDELTHQYKLTHLEHIPAPATDYAQEPSNGMWDADTALHNHENAKALAIIEASLASKNMSGEIQTRMIYIRAKALEALNRLDEALAEYVAIYQSAPESAWGKLAALHLECVTNCGQK